MSAINAVPLLSAAADGYYQISRSVRLRSSATAYFSRTMGTPTNNKIWTWSGWIKRGAVSATLYRIMSSAVNGDESFRFESDKIRYYFNGAASGDLVTTQVFRDVSAWYHVVVAVDTTQATASNRVKIYVNGAQITSFTTATYPAQNYNTSINAAGASQIGASGTPTETLDGYLTEINFIDGQALTPVSFGEKNILTGAWRPRKYIGTYGANGFYLNFSDNSAVTAAAIGKDYSINGNNWTPNNISLTAGVTYDSMLDVPTPWADGGNGRGNYAVLNPFYRSTLAAPTYAQGNLLASSPSGTSPGDVIGSIGVSSGKWYWEFQYSNIAASASVYSGITAGGAVSQDRLYNSNGQYYNGSAFVAYGGSYTTEIIGVALDKDAGTIEFFKNGVSQGLKTGVPAGTHFPRYRPFISGGIASVYANFGQRPFSYTPPSGFKALNTQNLPVGSITTSGTFTGNATADGPFVFLNGIPTAMTINGNAVTFGTHADKLANGFKVRSALATYNTSGSNTYSITSTDVRFKYANAQVNP